METSDVEGQGEATRLRSAAGATASLLAPPKNYTGIRLGDYKYILWPSGEGELYDLARDPYELHSLQRNPKFTRIRAFLYRLMMRRRNCAGRTCREPAPELPPFRTWTGR